MGETKKVEEKREVKTDDFGDVKEEKVKREINED